MFSDKGEANPEFVKWAEDHVLMLHVTSYVFTDPHHDLCADRGGFGYPYVAFLDEDGQWLAGEHGVLDLKECEKLAGAARAMRDLVRTDQDGNDVKVFTARLRAEALSFEEARARHAQLKSRLSAEQTGEVEQLLVNREIAAELAALRREYPGHRELRRAMAPKVAALFRAGKVPTNRLAPHYMQALFGYALATKDRELYADALAKMEKLFGDDKTYGRALRRYREQLDSWK